MNLQKKTKIYINKKFKNLINKNEKIEKKLISDFQFNK